MNRRHFIHALVVTTTSFSALRVLVSPRKLYSLFFSSGPDQESGASNWFATQKGDIDGDSKDELLVERIAGPHSTVVRAYTLQKFQIKPIAKLYIDAATGFDLDDVDNDGAYELAVLETSKSAGLPYVMGFRDRVWYKLIDQSFVEIKRIEAYSPENLEESRKSVEGGWMVS